MILQFSDTHHRNASLTRQLGAACATYVALPVTAAIHIACFAWLATQNRATLRMIETLFDLLPRIVEDSLEAYATFILATAFAFLLSWVGFAFLLPLFHLQRKIKLDGWLPTILIGATLGALAVMPISLGPLDYSRAARHMFGYNAMPYFAGIGALHAAAFWFFLHSFTAKQTAAERTESLPLFG